MRGELGEGRGGQKGTHTYILYTYRYTHTHQGGWVVVRDSWAWMNGVGEVAVRVVSECVLCVLCEKVCALVFACLLYVSNYILCIFKHILTYLCVSVSVGVVCFLSVCFMRVCEYAPVYNLEGVCQHACSVLRVDASVCV